MKHFNLEIETRSITGNQVRKIRNMGYIPAVIYSKFLTPTNIQFKLNDFIKLFRQAGKTGVIDLTVEGKSYPCLVHKVDVNPISDIPRHVDFLAVDLTKTTETEVPIEFINENKKISGATIVKQLNSLLVEALPEKIPHQITVDLSSLKEIGDVLTVSDVPVTKDYTILSEPEAVIVTLSEEDKETLEDQAPTAQVEPTSSENPEQSTK